MSSESAGYKLRLKDACLAMIDDFATFIVTDGRIYKSKVKKQYTIMEGVTG